MRQRVWIPILGLAWITGCGPETAGAGATGYEIDPPLHPAMTAPATRTASPASARRTGQSQLPPGHPPAAASGGTRRSDAGAGAAQPAGADGVVEVAGLRYKVPEGWISEAPASSMRLAQYSLPRVEGDAYDGLMTVTQAGGSIDDNIQRWSRDQFAAGAQTQVERRRVGDLDVTVVKIDGAFLFKERPMAPGPAETREDHRLLAAIVAAPSGQIFFKGVGPRPTMERWQEAFDLLVGSFQK